MKQFVGFPEDPVVANRAAAWVLVSIGLVGVVSTLLGFQYDIALPWLAFNMGWGEQSNPSLELRFNVLGIAIAIAGFCLLTYSHAARVTGLVVSIGLALFGIGSVAIMLLIAPLRVMLFWSVPVMALLWMVIGLWVALTLVRADVIALYTMRASALPAAEAIMRQRLGDNTDSLHVQLSTDRQSYMLGDDVRVGVTVTNASDDVMFLLATRPAADIVLAAQRADGTPVIPNNELRRAAPEITPVVSRLGPGQSWRETREAGGFASTREWGIDFTEAGRFTITARRQLEPDIFSAPSNPVNIDIVSA